MINALVAIYHLLTFVHVPFALGFSIIVLTVIIRFILYPFTTSQLRVAKKMQSVSHHVANLKEKHKGDSKRIQQETMKLYKEHGINPAAGCLPLLIQLPLFWALYSVLQQAVSVSPSAALSNINQIVYFPLLHLTKPWDPTFLGIPLGQGPSGLISTIGPIVLLVPIITGVLQYIQSKMMLPQVDKEAKKLQKKNDDFAATFQSQATYIFPIMIGVTSYAFPIGMSLYWNTFSVFGIIQQYKISGWGGLLNKKSKIKN